jgi:hypothetical protein
VVSRLLVRCLTSENGAQLNLKLLNSVFFNRFLDSESESVAKFGKRSKLTEIFEYDAEF